MPETAQQRIIRIAKGEVGYHEGRSGGHWNNNQKYSDQVPGLEWSDRQPWCDTFVHWVALKADVLDLWPDVTAKAKGGSASCDISGAAWKKADRWSEYPAIGAQVFFGTPADLNHTGVVVDYDATYVWSVEGNTNTSGSREGDGVYLKKHLRRSANVVGYGYPAYPGGIKSADPAWASGHKGKPSPKKPAPTPPAKPKALRVDLVDLSHHNQKVVSVAALNAAAKDGARGIYHKATEGKDFRDPRYSVVRGMNTKGPKLRWGAYHYAQPDQSSGVQQARWFLSVAHINPGNLPPVLDLEERGGLSLADLDQWVEDFCVTVEKAIGCRPEIYDRNINLKSTHGARLWTSRYNDDNRAPALADPWHDWAIWQFSDGQLGTPKSIAGLGHVDLNTINGDPGKFLTGYRVPEKAEPTPDPTPPAGVTTVLTQLHPPKVLAHETSDHNGVIWSYRMTSGELVHFGQWNVQGTDPTVQTTKLIRGALPKAGIWVFNECETLAVQNFVHRLDGYGSYLPGVELSDDGRSVVKASAKSWNAIVWDLAVWEQLDDVHLHCQHVNGGVLHITPERVVNRIALRNKLSGEILWRQAAHAVHHIEVAGRARIKGAITGQNHRAKVYFAKLAHDAVYATSVPVGPDNETAPLFGSGDLNVDFDADRREVLQDGGTSWFPYRTLGPVADILGPNEHAGTHGARLIDWGWLRQATA